MEGVTGNIIIDFDTDVRFVGFDCAHYQDISPSMLKYGLHAYEQATYKNITFVKSEIEDMVKQLNELT